MVLASLTPYAHPIFYKNDYSFSTLFNSVPLGQKLKQNASKDSAWQGRQCFDDAENLNSSMLFKTPNKYHDKKNEISGTLLSIFTKQGQFDLTKICNVFQIHNATFPQKHHINYPLP